MLAKVDRGEDEFTAVEFEAFEHGDRPTYDPEASRRRLPIRRGPSAMSVSWHSTNGRLRYLRRTWGR